MTEKEKLRGAIASAVCNARNYPDGVSHTVLGRDMSGVVDAVLEAVEGVGLLEEIERLKKMMKKVPFEVGDIVREVGEEEPTGEVIHIKDGPHEKGYLVKLYRPPSSGLFKSITYYEDEIELIERPGR